MEKPRKKKWDYKTMNKSDFYGSLDEAKMLGWNQCHVAMSTWIEGQVPTVEEIEKVVNDVFLLSRMNKDDNWCKNVSKAIHALITRKLTGKLEMSKELKTCNYCGGDGYYTDDDNKPCNPNKSPEVSVPTVREIRMVLDQATYRNQAEAIHALITRKLTGSAK